MSEHIKALTEQRRIALARAIAETYDQLFPNGAHPWQVYVTLNPKVSYEVFVDTLPKP